VSQKADAFKVGIECPQCGTPFRTYMYSFLSGDTTSCGCVRWRGIKTHGHSRPRSREYRSWESMRRRCFRPNAPDYKWYGGRGIIVCYRWSKFENFLDDMGARPLHKSLDRIDANGNYTPDNCRWATSKQQRNNRRKIYA
jgi:hypothetical protein